MTMESVWKLQDARAKFSKIIDSAIASGPQFVSRRGRKAAVVLSVAEYEQLVSLRPSFTQFLLDCPKMDQGFDIERQKDMPRDIDL